MDCLAQPEASSAQTPRIGKNMTTTTKDNDKNSSDDIIRDTPSTDNKRHSVDSTSTNPFSYFLQNWEAMTIKNVLPSNNQQSGASEHKIVIRQSAHIAAKIRSKNSKVEQQQEQLCNFGSLNQHHHVSRSSSPHHYHPYQRTKVKIVSSSTRDNNNNHCKNNSNVCEAQNNHHNSNNNNSGNNSRIVISYKPKVNVSTTTSTTTSTSSTATRNVSSSLSVVTTTTSEVVNHPPVPTSSRSSLKSIILESLRKKHSSHEDEAILAQNFAKNLSQL